MPKGDIPGEFEQTVMLALASLGDDVTGREIYENIVAVTGRDVALASVHVTLGRLDTKGLVRTVTLPAVAGRAVRRFSLTARGGAVLRRAHDHWERLWEGANAHPVVRDD